MKPYNLKEKIGLEELIFITQMSRTLGEKVNVTIAVDKSRSEGFSINNLLLNDNISCLKFELGSTKNIKFFGVATHGENIFEIDSKDINNISFYIRYIEYKVDSNKEEKNNEL